MARFRRSGTNWEGRRWSTSPALNALMDEIERAYPAGHPTDGTVASRTHDQNNPRSDHRPYPYTGTGIVNAVDAGENVEDDAMAIAEAIRKSKDPRVKYVIHERRLFSSYNHANGPAWTWRPYSGSSHLNHVHVSILRSKQTDPRPWNLDLGGENVEEVVKGIQRGLAAAGFDPGPIDGIWGPRTEAAFTAMSEAASQSAVPGPPGPAGPRGPKGADGTLVIKGEVTLP